MSNLFFYVFLQFYVFLVLCFPSFMFSQFYVFLVMIPFTILKLNFLYLSTKEKRFRFIALGNYNTIYFQIKMIFFSLQDLQTRRLLFFRCQSLNKFQLHYSKITLFPIKGFSVSKFTKQKFQHFLISRKQKSH